MKTWRFLVRAPPGRLSKAEPALTTPRGPTLEQCPLWPHGPHGAVCISRAQQPGMELLVGETDGRSQHGRGLEGSRARLGAVSVAEECMAAVLRPGVSGLPG